jgi:hypothetical protein
VAKSFNELRERLLRAGVAPRHVRRYLAELADHLADLRAEQEQAGLDRADAEAAALMRLGGADALAEAMIEQRQLQSWCSRAPWAVFSLGPLIVLAVAYLVAGLILWSGWKIFLPESETPFVPTEGLSVLYFGVGKLDYFFAPVLVGWGIGLFAARQRSMPIWPIVGLILNALIASAVQFHVVRPHIPGADGRVSVGFAFASGLGHAFGILMLTVAPYFLWLSARAIADRLLAVHRSGQLGRAP